MARGDRPVFLTNVIDSEGEVHLPLDERGCVADHIAGERCKVIEGTPTQTPRGGYRLSHHRDYGPNEARRDSSKYANKGQS